MPSDFYFFGGCDCLRAQLRDPSLLLFGWRNPGGAEQILNGSAFFFNGNRYTAHAVPYSGSWGASVVIQVPGGATVTNWNYYVASQIPSDGDDESVFGPRLETTNGSAHALIAGKIVIFPAPGYGGQMIFSL